MKKEKRIEKIYSLTPMQEGMLFHFLKDEDAVFYFEQYLFTLKGDVDVSILEKSFNILIKRHDILRTQFVYDKIQNPKQVVIEDLKLDIYFEDISRLTEEKKKAYLVSLKKEDMEKGFDLTGEILMRVYVLKTGADSYRLLWNTHHITMDGWSNAVFIDELIEVYIALKRGESPRLKPTVPFRNYVKWLEKQDKAEGINYWRQYLEGYTHSAALPELITPPANGKYGACENDFHIDELLTTRLTGMAADLQVTLNTAFQALWGLLLQIYNNTDDVVFGTVVSGRPPEIDGIEKMVGLFINSVPVRIKSSPGQLFSQLLTNVHKNATKSKSYEYLPLADIQECSALKRVLINHLLTFENYPVETHMRDAGKVKGLGFRIEDIDMFDQINYDFDIIVIPGKSLSVKFSFNRLVYDPGYVKQVEFHFRQLIEQVVDNPHIPLNEIDILSKEEKKQLLVEFNNTSSCFPDHKTIHELFEDQVETDPDRIAAVNAVHLHLTYRQLNEGADRLANYLVFEKKIQPGRPVGILMERSCDYITAILGILKAGGAYAPISLSFPPERIKYVIADAAIDVVISQKKYIKLLNRLQWECPSLKSFLAVDTWDIYSVIEIEKDELKHEKELWNYMGQKATDEITGGGWLTSYTGEPFSKEEMDEYGDSTLKKLQPLLHKEMRVLEVGCASGITMYRIAPRVGFYYGADLSSVIIEKNKERNRIEGIENIALACVPAHQIDSIEEKDFDLVIINSVIQDFQEYNYLRKALRKAVDMLGNNGHLFVGDIMDLDLKEKLIRELVEFKEANRGRGYRTKTDFSLELFVSREFFEDFQAENKVVSSVEFSGKIFTIENELTKFRYDALFHINKTAPGDPVGRTKHKYQDDLRTLAKYRGVPLKRPVEPSAPAYVLYTSGTTGKPNGVVTEHRNVVNVLTWFGKTFQLTTNTHALQLTEYTFDPSVEEVFGALLHGGVVYVPDRDLAADVEEFRRFVDTRRINIINYVPTVLEQLLGHDPKLESLQVVITGGEPLKMQVKDRLIKRGYLLYNNYGPTEITVDALSSLCTAGRVTIGKPVSNMKCYILDKNSRLLPVGVTGELYISGDGVSRGYMNNPGLTAERFEVPGVYGRTYRTGDLARRLPDGDIEFCGRVDHQVKIRGFRVELGEIENHLTAHPRVKEAVVAAQGDGEQKLLCAYYVDAVANQPEFFPSIGEYPLYDELLYYAMTSDEPRNRSYRNAINRMVRGKTVVEIGTGQDVILARFCIEAGAKKVYAIEMSGESYEKAQRTIKSLGLAEKIILVFGDAREVELPEKADVCVSEIIGTIGGSEGAPAILNNARRFLKQDGVMIPGKCITRIAAVSLPLLLRKEPGFSEIAVKYIEKLFDHFGYTFDFRLCVRRFPKSSIVSNSEVFEMLDFSRFTDETGSDKITLIIDKETTLDGFLLWINLHTAPGEDIDILAEECSWLPVFVPLPVLSIEVSEGDVIKADCIKTLSVNNVNPDYKIKGVLLRKKGNNVEFECDLPYYEKSFRRTPYYKILFDENAGNYVKNVHREVSDGEFRGYLEKKLPDYMIPSFFIKLNRLPLTYNGKIDRKALPLPGVKKGDDHVPPRNAVERFLVSIWSEVLGIKNEVIGIDADFFEIGGHSLKATILVSRIHKELNVKIPLKEIFKSPSIRKISAYIQGAEKEKYVVIEPAEKKEYYALSSAQKRLYILQQLDPGSAAYNMFSIVPLEEDIDVERLEETFRKLIARHESLRTSFHMVDNQPVQEVHEAGEVIGRWSLVIGESEAGSIVEDFNRPFDLSQAPLLRVGLTKTGETKFTLIFALHHIITDGTSHGVLTKEFQALYAGEKLSPLRLQYKDYAEWQNNPEQRKIIKQQEEYWLNLFQGQLPVLDLPNDYERPVMQSFEGASVRFVLNQKETGALKDTAREVGGTLYMVILAVLNILFSKLGGQEDIIVGTPVAARRHADLKNIVGMFLNTLAMRNYPAGEKSFKEFLGEVKQRTLDAYENQEYPFEDLVENISVIRDTSRNPVFSVMFNLLNQEEYNGDEPGSETEGSETHRPGTSKFDLNLGAVEYGRTLIFNLEYCTRLFKKETIDRIIGYFKTIVNSVVLNPGKKIANIEILPDAERKAKLSRFNEDLYETIETGTVQDRLSVSFQKYKDNIAIDYGAIKLSFSELDHRSTMIANRIFADKIEKGSFIGIYLDDRLEIAAAVLGILKAGCVFVPLDTVLPFKRIDNMVRLTNTRIIVTDTKNQKRLLNECGAIAESIETRVFDESFYKENKEPVLAKNRITYQPNDKIYVYFTSGSTGSPNAVVGRNEGLLHFINWEIDTFGVDQTFKFSQFINPGFDVFLRDTFIPLCAGGVICIPGDREVRLDIDRIGGWIEENGIDFIHIVPSMFKLIVSGNINGDSFKNLKFILLAGEKVNPAGLKKWYDVVGEKIQLVNIYGPTETTLAKVFHFITGNDVRKGKIPIGQAIKGSRIILLDRNLNVCGKGIVGELYIRTPYRSHGYYNNPGLNRERFIPNPFNNDPDDLIYKTGDLGREWDDGNIEFVGRVDRQVKIRGVRIELGEIESLLLKHGDIRDAVVVMREDGSGEPLLCAYIVSNREFTVTGLREYLSRELPDYMIPVFFVFLDKLPLNPNGKIDREALPEPAPMDAGATYIAPRDSLEEKLVEVWADVLNLSNTSNTSNTSYSPIGIDDNFFQLGGHSLKATIMISKVHEALDARVPLGQVFKTPTIRGVSDYLKNTGFGDRFISIEPVEEKEYYPLSSSQYRLYILRRLDPRGTGYNMPRQVTLVGKLEKERLERSFRELIRRHESFRTSFDEVDGTPVQRIHDAQTIEFSLQYHELIGPGNPGQTAEEIESVVQGFVTPFDLSQAPLLRLGLIKVAEEKHILMLDMHHIISDGSSLGIFVNDLMAFYSGEALPRLPLQYRDFSEWRNRDRQKDLTRKQGVFWLKQMEGEVPVLNLPCDYTRPPVQNFEGSRVEFPISKAETEGLKTMALKEDVTLYILLLAIFNVLLSKLSGQRDIIVGTPVAGRGHAHLQQIIGMFVNTLALRNEPAGELSFKEFLATVKEKTLAAFENQEYPFEDLVDQVAVKRDMSRNPLFDVVFTLHNIDTPPVEIPGLTLKPYDFAYRIAKFDLTLSSTEVNGELVFTFEYATGLFKRETLERFSSFYRSIVFSVLDNPGKMISEIEIISNEERERLLFDFNNTETPYPKEKTIHRLFEEQVERVGDNIAVVDGMSVSYWELNRESEQLAQLLQARGVTPETIVGIMVGRSVAMIIGIMGILKAGGAYMPIDPEYPEERINYMLKDSGARLLVSINDKEGEKVRRWEGEKVLLEEISRSSKNSSYPLTFLPSYLLSSSNLAYIIYTSGTTGKPKGVLIEHRNVVRLLFNDRFQFDFNNQDSWSLFHSYGFDFSVWEMYGALLYGGRLVVIPKMTARDPQQFLEVLINHKVTVLNQTPSAFYNLIDEELKTNGKNLWLRYVIFGGEALKPARLKTWWNKYPETKLINMFGITETCVHVTYKEIGEIEIEGDVSNIGKPIPTLSTYIMDRYRRLAPIGTPGELYVGGEGVARGYLNRPGLTSERFVENSYKAGERLYRSGDLARICTEGEMVYLGRVDHQVQLRGFRIELGEIEHRLLKHEGIKEAVVMEQSIPSGDLYLCAYIVLQPGGHAVDLEAASIREFLSRQLPDYMIPSYFVHLEEIPLTSNGKIDRRRLPQPEVRIEKDHKLPRNKTEETLANAWQGILGLESVGIEDNFFDVGGDSIKAIRLISRINERLNSNLKIVDLYTNRTIGELAGLIDREESESVQALYRKVTSDFEELKKRVFEQMKEQGKWNPDEVEDIYPMSEIEKGMVFSYMKYAGTGIYHDQFVYPLYYKDFDIELFKKTLTLLVKKNEILRTGFNLDEFEEPVQVVYKEPRLELVYTDLAGLSQDDRFDRVESWLSEDRGNPFESSNHLLWRMHIFSFGNDRLYLLLTVHHAILDGWSNSILMTDLHNTYFELKKNPCYVPVKLKSGNKDMVIEERIEKMNTRAARFWKEELRDYKRLEFSETLKSKGELEPMKVFSYNAGMEILEKAKLKAVQWNTSVKNFFFSAYAFTMRMFSYENDMVLGCVTHNRPGKPDGDNILGCFLNTTPIRLKIPTSLSWKEYAVMVERKMLEVKQYERLPLFEIALAVGEKSKDRNPIFDTLFNFTDFHILRQVRMDESGSGIDQEINRSREIAGQLDTNTLFDFEVDITTGSLLIHPKYNAQVISENIVKKCCIYFVNILEKYINEPDSPARRDDILPLEEKENLLQRFNDTRAAYSREKTMPMLFEEQVLKTQDNTAVIDIDGLRQFTYRELNEQSNRLANGLRKIGVGTGDFVGVVMERRMEMVLAVMAILKAGGAYAPLEPFLPDRRIEKILESLQTKCVVTDSCTRPRLEAVGASLEYLSGIVSLDKMGYREFKDNPVENPAPVSGPGDISYVIYTSGSTGTPKGVVETHRPVVNVIEWVNKTFNVGEKDKLLFVASLGFDLSVYDIFGILSSGGAIRTAGSGDMKEPLRLLEIIVREGITFWDSAPAALLRLVPFFGEVKEDGSITRLRLVFLSGDWIPVSMPDALREAFKGVRVISLGGATEATVWSNYYPIGDVDPSWPSIPYGKPIQNAKYYILDTSLNLCPIKIAGDLYIGGECLAKEYKNDPVLTAEKFIENPFCPGERLYKTGDIARWFEDGNMQFLGRKDHQVKIRGYRIELGEIESQLSGYPGIRETIVIDRKDGSGNKYICAYYTVERPGENIAKEELISYLGDELPEYMMPSYFISIDHIPVTPNGKLDRSALPEPELNTAEISYAAPEDELQEKMLGIWKEVLFGPGEEKVLIGIDDDFFQLGGHSLNATLVISKIHKTANVKVPLAEMFKYPTIRELSKVIKKSSKENYEGITVVEKKEYYGLSSAQKRLYILQQMDTDSAAYNLPVIISLPGESDWRKIERTFKELIKRHESLRTSFHMINDAPVQKIHEQVEFKIEKLGGREKENLSKVLGSPETLFQKGFWPPEAIIKSFVRPFDLTCAPLLRVGFVKGIDGTCILLVDMHHIISDGISHKVLSEDFMALYEGKALLPLRLQYKDFAQWQNGEREKESLKRQEGYWFKEFEGEIPVLDLPGDYPRPVMKSFEGASIDFEIPGEEARELTALALKESATLFMLLAAVFNILLSKLSGQEEIIIGTPIAGRRHADLEKIIGMFVNTLSLRNYPAGYQTFREFLGDVKERLLMVFENQEYPFEELVDKLSVRRDIGRNPLFDIMLVLQNMNMGSMVQDKDQPEFPKEYENIVQTVKFDLILTVIEINHGLFLSFQYCTKLFKEETIERFSNYFKKIVSITMKEPGIRLSEIEIIAEEEKRQILFDFNDTEKGYPIEKTIHRLFEEKVETLPDRIALVGADLRVCPAAFDRGQTRTNADSTIIITYRELNEQSNRLAGLLTRKGVLADNIVAIMVVRSVEMIIGIMGILKAGGAYMPVDPGYPQDRIDYMLKDSGAGLLVTTNNKEGGKVGGWEGEKVLLEDISKSSYPLTFLPSYLLSSSNLAYIIYTSGSTGRPKGVIIRHRAVVNRLNWMQRAYPIDENDVLIQKTPVTFDVSVWELFWWSFYGSSLFLPVPGVEKNPEALVRAIVMHRVTTIHFVPSMLNVWLDYIDNTSAFKRLTSLKQVFSSGEALEVYQAVKFNNGIGKINCTRLINLYGPTEACVDVSYFNCWVPAGQNFERVPIGKPIDNIRLYIVSEESVLQPIGIAGELLIGGVGLAVGYLNKPELTAEKFRLNRSYKSYRTYIFYKTGDLARWLPDGNVEFLGRIDQQVKIRGFRIEIGEIEHQLLKHHAVKEAVVIAREDSGEKYLCAYIVAGETSSAELREYLMGKLPEYMAPSYFVFMEKIPLNANGKVDKKALPLPGITPGLEYVAPRNRVEETFAVIWSEVLGTEKENIGIDSNFFQLGGHSLKAVALISKSHRAFNVKIPLTKLFEKPTIRYLAKYVTAAAEEKFLSIPAAEKREYYPLSPAQKRMYILQQVQLQGIGYNIPSVVLLDGVLDADKMEKVFEQLIERHESLRTSFEMINEEPVQVIHGSPLFKVEYYSLERRESGGLPIEMCKTMIHDFIKPFDLSRAPLMRVGLALVENAKHLLMLDMHHIITDGASQGILIKEFVELYHGKELPPLRIDYKDYALWRAGAGQQGVVKEMEAYWLEVFAGEIPLLDLPIDHPRPPLKRFEGSSCIFTVDAGETRALKTAAKADGATLYMVLLAVYYIVLSKLSGREDIVVGTPTAGRHHDDIRQIVGMFVNTLALRNKPSGEKPFKVFLAEVKQRTLEAFERQGYPFEELVDRLDVRRDTGRNPLFDVMFALHNIEVEARELPNLTVSPIDLEVGISKFDMTLNAAETGEEMEFSVAYAVALFESATVQRFSSYFKTAVSAVIRDPGQTISEIDVIPQEEREALLHVFNDADANYPADKTIHQLFEAQAARSGDRVAVIADGAITYNELNKRADLLARELRRKGVASGSTAAITGERSIETVIGILAILKAGGAYLPIDPGYPRERIQYMLADSNARVLLGMEECQKKLIANCKLLMGPPQAPYHHSSFINHHSNQLAYIIYTSGSTGRPKGVMVAHRSVVNLVYALEQGVYGCEAPVNVGMVAPFTFDASVKQLFPSLLLGHCLVIVPGEARLDGLKLIRFYKKNQVALSDGTPAHLDIIVESAAAVGSMEDFPVRRFLVGGEELHRSTAERFINTTGVEDIVNVYGPTECCDVTTTFTITRDILNQLERIPVGKPLNNVKTVVLGSGGKLQPIGVPGELVIGGGGVARGYINNPALTAEKFRLNRSYKSYRTYIFYKTGDLARILPDGNIQFLGRMDNQVKVRGFRIEPAEIENCLRRYEGTQEAVVAPGENGGETYLCAYVVSRNTVFDDSACREYLSKYLPGYMVPLHIVPLEKIPLTAAGKIDREALPKPNISSGGAYAAPTGEIEKKLAKIWADILGLEENIIGIDDDFFRLGGHSLKATIMVRKIHKEFNIEISLGDIFKMPTIRGISSLIGAVELVGSRNKNRAAEIEEVLL